MTQRISALIQRDSASIPVDVLDYEIAVLREIHGEENVIVADVAEAVDADGKPIEVDAVRAYEALLRKYRGNEAAVRMAYRNPGEIRAAVKEGVDLDVETDETAPAPKKAAAKKK